MKKEILSIIVSLLSLQLYSQVILNDTIPIDHFSEKILKSNDILFIENDNDQHIMGRSPLFMLKGYKGVYKNHDFPVQMPRYFQEWFSQGPYDKEFQCIWLIKDEQLYLTRVLFDNVEIDQGRKDQYAIIEQFTGEKFDTRYNNISEGDNIRAKEDERYGLMPATWFSDTLFVKKTYNTAYNKETWQEDQLEWVKKDYIQMIFKNGKLVKTKKVANKVKRVPRVIRRDKDKKTVIEIDNKRIK
ncbi:hypothetical protein [Proteiniphilum sp.]|uniref:hypothetical protein n=1 Tax=Proteiniphilum sp. TaxID=1926877 RepID=UPI002B1F1FA1|nr:hypothetical protein [Proteiniphilum sp.]MEA4917835.1 hypothetical protein [Proteiniphilum sp.]